jgi:HD-GYP domain-containing protein (c-di-GMP phosphodiesterase class II)
VDGVYVNLQDQPPAGSDSESAQLGLLAKSSDMEVMVQTLFAHATAWLVPAEDSDTMEFFFVLSGCISLMLEEGAVTLDAGKSFYVKGLQKELYIQTSQESRLLYVTNRPLYDSIYDYQVDLNKLMRQVDEKDNYTYRHCKNVMRFSVKILRRLLGDDASFDNLVVAALFHDVGKCFVPDEILQKQSSLTRIEFQRMMRHSMDSARLLVPKFGKVVADIARSHHERLDGSGYPFGLTGDEIPFESRIISVADSFDAMTTKRPYNTVKSYEEAADELFGLPEQYDQTICAVLKELVNAGEIPGTEEPCEDDR